MTSTHASEWEIPVGAMGQNFCAVARMFGPEGFAQLTNTLEELIPHGISSQLIGDARQDRALGVEVELPRTLDFPQVMGPPKFSRRELLAGFSIRKKPNRVVARRVVSELTGDDPCLSAIYQRRGLQGVVELIAQAPISEVPAIFDYFCTEHPVSPDALMSALSTFINEGAARPLPA